MYFSRTLVVLAFAIVAVVAGPTGQRTSCASECSAEDRFSYEYGRSYAYRYKAETETITGNGETAPGVVVEAEARIQSLTPCELVLTLSDVSVQGSPRSQEFASAVSRHSLRFSLQNGRVEDVCPSVDEPIWVTNFKKGILSTFQNSMSSEQSQLVTESDVSGECETQYEIISGGRFMEVRKTKSPSECQNRPEAGSKLSTLGFNLDSIVGSASPLSSSQSCVQKISENIIQASSCQESHKYLPFTENESIRVETLATTSLTFVSVSGGQPLSADPFTRRTGLMFEETEAQEELKIENLSSLIQQLDSASLNDVVSKDVPALFSELISALKQSSYKQIQTLYKKFSSQRSKKFLIDALPLVGTSESTSAVADMVLDDSISEEAKNIWYTSLALIKRPSKSVFVTLLSVIEMDVSQKSMLGVSALLHNYCEMDSKCEQQSEIEAILRQIESSLGVSCRSTSDEQKDAIVIALKALGNAGRWINAESALRRCFTENNPMEVRVAAINAWRRSPCSYNRNTLLSTYEDHTQENEVRIAAYMAIMQCPTQDIVDTVKARLVSESVNQVASFVWSHLTNVQESADQQKQYIRQLIGEETLQKKFSADALKFSRYYESSLFSNSSNLGGSAEGSVIFESDSFLPRSGNLNLTVNLFGKSINLFEIGARMEGYEQFIEKFFGPNGYYPDETIEQLIKNLRDSKQDESEQPENVIESSAKEPQASLFVRMLGNEMMYTNHIGAQDILAQLGFSSPMEMIVELTRNKKIEFMKSYNIISTTINVPTITGFPLSLTLDGSATVAVDVGGQFEFEGVNSFTIDGKIRPSAAINIESTMVIDAFVTRSGVKYSSTLHTATAIEGRGIVKGKHLIDFSVKAPEQDLKIFDFSQEFIRINNDQEETQQEEQQKTVECRTSQVLGVALCKQSYEDMSSSPRLFNIPSSSVYIQKTDSHKSYDFHFILDSGKLSVLLDMPGSRIDSKKSLSLIWDGQNYSMDIHSQTIAMGIKGQVDIANLNKMVTAEFALGDDIKYSGELRLNRDYSNGWSFNPIVIVRNDQGEASSELTATASHSLSSKSFTVMVNHFGILSIPAGNLDFALNYGKGQRDFTMNLNTENVFRMDLAGSTKFNTQELSLAIDGSYTRGSRETQALKLDIGAKRDVSESGSEYSAHLSIPMIELEVSSEAKVTPQRYVYVGQAMYKQFDLKLDGAYDRQIGSVSSYRKLQINVASSALPSDIHISKEARISEEKMSTSTNVKCGEVDISQEMVVEFGRKSSFVVTYNNDKLINVNLEKSQSGKISAEVYLGKLIYKKTIQATGTFHNKSVSGKMNAEIELSAMDATFRSSIIAEQSQLSISMFLNPGTKSKTSEGPYHLEAEARPNHLHFDTNIYRTVVVDARINQQEDITKAEINAQIESVPSITISGEFSPEHVSGAYSFGEQTIQINGKVNTQEVEASVQWSPSEKFTINANYDLGASPSIVFSVRTPFTGWEKQEARFNYTLKDQQLKGQLSVTWKNVDHISANFNTNADLQKRQVAVQLSFTSTISNFERLELTINHNGLEIEDLNSEIRAKYGESLFHAKVQSRALQPSGVSIDASVVTPYTAKWESTLKVRNPSRSLLVDIDSSYGERSSKINFSVANKGIDSTIKLFVSSTHLPQIDMSGKLRVKDSRRDSDFKLDLSGTIGGEDIGIVLTGSPSETSTSKTYKLTLAAVQPYTSKPFKMHLDTSMHSSNLVELDFDMSHAHSSLGGPLKFHAKTNFMNLNPRSVFVSAHLSSPQIKISTKISSKILKQSFDTTASLEVNSHYFSVSTGGQYDASTEQADLSLDVKSSCSRIDGLKLEFQHKSSPNSRDISLQLETRECKHTIQNSFKRSAPGTWENTLKYNDLVTITHKYSSSSLTGDRKFEFNAKFAKNQFEGYVSCSQTGEKQLYFAVDCLDMHCHTKVTLKGNYQTGVVSIESMVPCVSSELISAEVSYALATLPVRVTANISNGDKAYVVEAEVTEKSIKASMNKEYTLSSEWELESASSMLNCVMQTPEKKYSFDMDVKRGAVKSVAVSMKAGSVEYQLEGRVDNGQYTLDINGPNTLTKAVINVTPTTLTGQINKDGSTIELSMEGNFKKTSGMLDVSVRATQYSHMNSKMSMSYSFESSNQQISLSGNIGSQQYRIVNYIQSSMTQSEPTKFGITIETPMELLRQISLTGESIWSPSQKSLEVASSYNSQKKCSLKATFDQSTAAFDISSSAMEFKSLLDFAQMSLSGSYMRNAIAKTRPISYQFNFDLKKKQISIIGQNVQIEGSVSLKANGAELSAYFQQGQSETKVTGEISMDSKSFAIKSMLASSGRTSTFDFNANTADKKSLSAVLKHEGETYMLSWVSHLLAESGDATLRVNMPMTSFKGIKVEIDYRLDSVMKTARLNMDFDGHVQEFSVASKIDQRNYSVTIMTPLEGLQRVVVEGSFEMTGDSYALSGGLETDSHNVKFQGKLIPTSNGYSIEAQLPIGSDYVRVEGTISNKKISLNFVNENNFEKNHFVTAEYTLNPNAAALRVQTSLPELSSFVIDTSYTLVKEQGNVRLVLQKNDFNFEVKGDFFVSQKSSRISLKLYPGSGNEQELHMHYDIQAGDQDMEIKVVFDEQEHFIRVDSIYSFEEPLQGLLRVATSCPRINAFVLEYDFEQTSSSVKGVTSVRLNEETYTFRVKSAISDNVAEFEFTTPFDGYRQITFVSELNTATRQGQLQLQLGGVKVSMEAAYTPEKIYLNIETPFEEAKLVRFIMKNVWTSSEKALQFGLGYNADVFEIGAQILSSLENSGFMLKFVSPLTEDVEIQATYNLKDTTDLVNLKLNMRSIEYVFRTGVSIEDQKASIKAVMNLPIESVKNVIVDASIDLSAASSGIKLYVESNGVVHMNIQGKLNGEETIFAVDIPSQTFGNIKSEGRVSRSKRSVEFMMMNDQAKGSVAANFHSFKMSIETPFEKMKTLEISVSKSPKGKLTINYKRNESYLNYERTPTKKSIDLKMDGSVPGWELLAITGRLDHETIQGYLTGALAETPMSITGKGSLGKRSGSASLVAKTGLEKLGTLNIDMEYKRKRSYTIKATSSANPDFKIDLQFKDGGLHVDVFIPHHETNTVAKGELALFSGELSITSRFAPIKSYSLSYSAVIKKEVDIKMKIVRNDVERFVLEFHKGGAENHFLIEGQLFGNRSKLHYHRMGFKEMMASFTRNGKELSAKLEGQGKLPTKGTISYEIKNSFRSETKEITGSIKIDRTKSPKSITLEMNVMPSGRQYTVYLKYNADLQNMRKGDFTLNTNTPLKIAAPWKSIKGKWNFNEKKVGKVSISVGNVEYKIAGKISLRDTDVTIVSSRSGSEKRFLGWRINRDNTKRDYYFKYGTEDTYTLLELVGDIQDLRNVDIKGKFRLRRMRNELSYTAKWSGNKDIGISGEGTFSIANKRGEFTLHKLKRDPSNRASNFKLTGTSNIKGFSSYKLEGGYSIADRMVDITAKWDTDEFVIKANFDNYSRQKSENKATFKIPGVGPVEITIAHDFTNPLDKTVEVYGTLAGKPFKYTEHSTRNEQYTKLNVDIDIQSNFIGVVKFTASYDMTDIDNAKGSASYTRDGSNNINVEWHRTKGETTLENEFTLDSKSPLIPSVKAHTHADWSSGITIHSGIEWKNKKIEANLSVGPKKAVASLITPFEKLPKVSAVATYKINKQKKDITFHYQRGERVIDLSVLLVTPSKKTGSLKLSLTTPFAFARTLTIDGNWEKGNFEAHYKRNDVSVDFSGKAVVKQGNSSFDVEFVLPSGKPVGLKLAYDLPDFIKGTSKKVSEILSLELSVGQKRVSLALQGSRNPERVMLLLDGTSTLEKLRAFHIKLDSEMNLTNREGELDVKINEFTFNMKNIFKKLETGYYFRTQMHSSLTKLPGLTIGFGREGAARTVTLGFGDEREITISLNGKNGFKQGFYGKIDIPRRGIVDIEYDINYSFKGNNKLRLEGDVQLKNGKKVSFGIDYHSDGVKARLQSPWTGLQQLRAKRSISDDVMHAELSLNDHLIQLQSGRAGNIIKKGITLSGQLFGKKVGIQAFADINTMSDSEAKFIIETPFQNYEKMGGYFTLKRQAGKLRAAAELEMFTKLNALLEIDQPGQVNGLISVRSSPLAPEYALGVRANVYSKKQFVSIEVTDSSAESSKYTIHMDLVPQQAYVTAVMGDYTADGSVELTRNPLALKISSNVAQAKSIVYKNEIAIEMSGSTGLQFSIESLYQNSHQFSMKLRDTKRNDSEFVMRFDSSQENHEIFIQYSPVVDGVKVAGMIESTRLSFRKADFSAVVVTSGFVKVLLQAKVQDVLHKINIEADNKPAYLLVDIASPLLQSGVARAEVKLRGRSLLKMKTKFTLSDANDSYSAKISTNMDTASQKTIDVEFRSPIETLKKLKFGLGYLNSAVQELYMYSEPQDLKSRAYFGVQNKKAYIAGFSLTPGSLAMKAVSAEAVIPLKNFKPKFSATFGDNQYDVDMVYNVSGVNRQVSAQLKKNGFAKGFNMVYRDQAPFEWGYEMYYQQPGMEMAQVSKKFHVMFDSSLKSLVRIPRDDFVVYVTSGLALM